MDGTNNIAALREARKWSRPQLAERMGTSPQQVERLEKGQRKLTLEWINRAAQALEVQVSDIIGQVENPVRTVRTEARPFRYEGASMERMREDLPIYGTALGAPRVIDGDAVEQTMLNSGETVGYLKRPVMLNGRSDVYGLYVVNNSMWPIYPEGSTIVAEMRRPPKVGDDVVVYLTAKDGEDHRARAVLIKRLVRRTASHIELEQFQPAVVLRIPVDEVFRVDRVMTLGDLLS